MPEWVFADCAVYSASQAIAPSASASGAPGANASGRKAPKPRGVTPRASATAATSRPIASQAGARAGSEKLPVIESAVSAVANSIAP